MAFHSYHSSRRIRALAVHHDHHHRIFGLESSDYDVSGDTPAITRPGSPSLGIRGSVMKELYKMSTVDQGTREGSVESCEVCEDAEETGDAAEGAPILAETGGGESGPGGPALVPPTQPILTGQQERMVSSLSALPQLERVVAWFPGVFNAHAVVVARNARIPRWSWQGVGRYVMAEWARKCVAAIQVAAGGPEPDFSLPAPAQTPDHDWSEDMDVDSLDTPRETRETTPRETRETTGIEISVSELRPSPSESERSHSIA